MLERLTVDPDSNVSLTAQLVEQLRLLIAAGDLAPGAHLPPIRDMAGQLGIHMHTVRIAYQRLEEEGLVSIRRRRGTIVQEFHPLEWAEARSATPTFSFGVLLPGTNPVYDAMIQGITEITQRTRWLPMFSFSSDNPILADRLVNQMVARQVDGFIVVATGMMQVFEDAAVLANFPPIVFVDSPDMPGMRVLADNAGGAFLSTLHLIEHGCAKIGMISAPLDFPNVRECSLGFRRALHENGLEADPDLIVEAHDFTTESGCQAGLHLFQQAVRPEAVFVASDILAVGVIQALNQLGLRVPQDVALASFDDSPYAALTHPPLTSSSFPAYELGKAAAVMLQQAIQTEEIPQKQLVLPSKLVVRQSCGCNLFTKEMS